MSDSVMSAKVANWFKAIISLAPFALSMYLLYYAGKHGIWMPDTLHRDKITIIALVVGMASSLFLYTFLSRSRV